MPQRTPVSSKNCVYEPADSQTKASRNALPRPTPPLVVWYVHGIRIHRLSHYWLLGPRTSRCECVHVPQGCECSAGTAYRVVVSLVSVGQSGVAEPDATTRHRLLARVVSTAVSRPQYTVSCTLSPCPPRFVFDDRPAILDNQDVVKNNFDLSHSF